MAVKLLEEQNTLCRSSTLPGASHSSTQVARARKVWHSPCGGICIRLGIL